MVYTSELICGVRVGVSRYVPTSGGRVEAHAVFVPTDVTGGVSGQSCRLMESLRMFLLSAAGSGLTPVMKRVFLSDVTNEASVVRAAAVGIPGVLSVIGQCPLRGDGVKVAMLAVMISGVDVESVEAPGGVDAVIVRRGEYKDLWASGFSLPGADSYEATGSVMSSLSELLGAHGMILGNDCLRTWFYVRDIDNRYKGMVRARNEVFSRCGLTADSHFIASTGIEGINSAPDAVVTLDAFATSGLSRSQVRYLNALSHLNATINYGVSFERATSVDYGDRRHIIVSGTASIDNTGSIVAPGDISGQCERMADNVAALLAEGGGAVRDVAHIILYLRDISDCAVASAIVARRFAGVPCVVVHAPVCRPGWLVEMECMAIVSAVNGVLSCY